MNSGCASHSMFALRATMTIFTRFLKAGDTGFLNVDEPMFVQAFV